VARLAAAAGYPILAEPYGGLRFGPHDRGHAVAHYEAPIRCEEWALRHRPELIVRFGASLVWRHVTERMAGDPEAERILVDPGRTWDDPARLPATWLHVDPVPLCDALAERLGTDHPRMPEHARRWRTAWRDADAVAASALTALLSSAGGADRTTAWTHRTVVEHVPDGALLVAANSMAVRDLDAFAPSSERRIRALANRGAAGIDGTLASALGAAQGWGAPTVLLTGDLAFAHDQGGLAAVAAAPSEVDLTIVVLNDGGGGIFEHLPVAERNRAWFERYFATPSALDIGLACAAHGVPHTVARDAHGLAEAVSGRTGVGVVEVPVDRAANTAWHRRYWAEVADRLA